MAKFAKNTASAFAKAYKTQGTAHKNKPKYNLKAMNYNPEMELLIFRFTWTETPQGWEFWADQSDVLDEVGKKALAEIQAQWEQENQK